MGYTYICVDFHSNEKAKNMNEHTSILLSLPLHTVLSFVVSPTLCRS